MKGSYRTAMIVSALLILCIAFIQHNPYTPPFSDATKGFFSGVQIALMALPVILYKRGKSHCIKNNSAE